VADITPLGFLVARFLFHNVYSHGHLTTLSSWQSALPNAIRGCLLVRKVIKDLLHALLIPPEGGPAPPS
jgi:hypothetical protein